VHKALSSLLLFATVPLAGCATAPVSLAQAKAVPSDRIYAFAQAPGSVGSITFVRDKGMMGAGCYMAVFINGQRAAMLDTGEKVTVTVAAGRVNVGAGPDGAGLCGSGMATRNKREVQVIVDVGDRLIYRVATNGGGDLSIGPASE
jgi:hypothetical protein